MPNNAVPMDDSIAKPWPDGEENWLSDVLVIAVATLGGFGPRGMILYDAQKFCRCREVIYLIDTCALG